MAMRVILITGANGALGDAMARAFLADSNTTCVALGFHTGRQRIEAARAEFGERVLPVQIDVTQRPDWDAGVRAVIDKFGRLDVLVNNAGTHEDALLGMMPATSWNRVLATNLDAVFHGAQSVLPSMISQRGGRIVNMASLSALNGPAGQANYAAAKAGVVAVTQSLAKEVARLGITVNAVCPGYIETEALHGLAPERKQAAISQIPMRRLGRPEEVAAAVVFLASAAASYVTGSILKVDGGIL